MCETPEMNAMDCLLTRRSVRSYREEKPPRELIEQVVTAGQYAPSAMGRQSAFYVAVQEAQMVKKLSQMNAQVMNAASDPFYGAPCVVLAFAQRGSQNSVEDATLGLGNMMNAAHALGLGSCWINRVKEMFDSPQGYALMRTLGVPEDMEGVGSCILGYAKDATAAPKARRANAVYIV